MARMQTKGVETSRNKNAAPIVTVKSYFQNARYMLKKAKRWCTSVNFSVSSLRISYTRIITVSTTR